MRVLLDECVDARVKDLLPQFEVRTVSEVGSRTLDDGPLLVAAAGRIDVLVTTDKGIEHQQNWRALPFGVLVVHVLRNRVDYYEPLQVALRDAITRAAPGTLQHVGSVGRKSK